MKKKNEAGEINLPDFKVILQSRSYQDSMVLAQRQKYKPIEQDRKPRNKPCTYRYLIFDKGGKNIQWKDSFFNKWGGKTGQLCVKK